MCNKPSGHKKPQKCKIQARRKQEIPKVGPSYRFIFDVEADTTSNDRTEKGCSTLQVFDQYLGTCRDLLCPFQRLAYRGTCKQRQFVANNRLFPVVVKVKLSIPFPISSFKSSGGSLYGTFLKELNLTSNTFCRIQKSSMASFSNSFHGNVEFLLLSLAIRSSPACNEEWIAEFIDLRQTPTSTRVNVEGVQVPVTMETSLQQYPAEILYRKTVLFTYGEDCTDCYTVTIGRLFCPHVKLSKSEYCLVQKKLHDSNLSTCHSGTLSVNENFVMDQNVETGISADIFYMCWSDYERLAGKVNDNIVNGGSSGRNISSVHLFLFMYISLVVRYLVPLLCSYRI
ncbi:uncharacterized protein LOC123532621 [Mercenaria mercenaria]|uniref:uncharacterized protein LOC123532621 n=1 Tax=Mercenaria mercenaria TaxID=6596 RepID=UPI00234F1FE3|nr:uncharacterized protein LOC123532621 [Mercenaria mercenaria]